ncbi:hypothetical protein SUGI_0769320 [Cryptomeria japonica]|nr:hypothetical protein SUGI_0769320 [Cryptomeria japonica]
MKTLQKSWDEPTQNRPKGQGQMALGPFFMVASLPMGTHDKDEISIAGELQDSWLQVLTNCCTPNSSLALGLRIS